MNSDLKKLVNLCEQYGLNNHDGFSDTYIDEIKLFKVSSNDDLMPLLYNKGFSFIGQGRKIGYINDKKFEHGFTDYLVISSPQPVECETYILGDEPLIGIYINLDMNRLQRVVRKFSKFTKINKASKEISFSITCNIRTEVIHEIYLRLLSILENKIESKMLFDGLLDELYYRILQ
ncbi:MAG: AraC family transcriptional regulator, partial [Campylobacteraceae bacterium]|nr:AraC family transcriptional regulator [Campylobacteraceae bacterium]